VGSEWRKEGDFSGKTRRREVKKKENRRREECLGF